MISPRSFRCRHKSNPNKSMKFTPERWATEKIGGSIPNVNACRFNRTTWQSQQFSRKPLVDILTFYERPTSVGEGHLIAKHYDFISTIIGETAVGPSKSSIRDHNCIWRGSKRNY